MKTFDGWRAVGRAMRWARRQDGVTVERVARADVRARIYRSPEDKIVWVSSLPGSTWFRTYSGRVGSAECTPNAAAEGLRVLGALDLIPAELVPARDERYRRCVKCDRIARWWDDGPGFEPRWVHVRPIALTGPSAHRAEVAE